MLKRLVKAVMPYLPSFVRRRIHDFREQSGLAKARARKRRTVVSLDAVKDCLTQFQFEGDTLVHSSASNIGRFACPVPRLVDCLLEAIDIRRNTVLVPALPFASSMKEYLDLHPAFDVRSAPNAMGAISNIVMRRDGALRSVHPTHSVAALGPRAQTYVGGHHRGRTPFGEDSPYMRLQQEHGKVLMFGVGLNSVTNFHVYEDMLGKLLPVKVYVDGEYSVECLDADGGRLNVITACHSPAMSARRNCERARKHLLAARRIHTLRLGEAEVSLLDARGLTLTLLEMLLEGESIYGSVTLSGEQRSAVERRLSELQCR